MKAESASSLEEEIQKVIASPGTSHRLRNALEQALERDCVTLTKSLGKFTMDNEAMNKRLDSFSEDEIELVLQFRARQARQITPARWVARVLSLLASFAILVILSIAFIQAVKIKNHGYSGEIPAPLSWIAAITNNVKS